MNIYTVYASLSHREAGMRLRRSIICCSSVLLCAVSASSASAWSIVGLLWTVVDLCSSVGCFHTPSIIRFSTTDPLFCTKTILSRYEGKLTALKSLDLCLLNGIFSVFFCTLSEYSCTLVVQTVPHVRLITDAETCWGKWQEQICSKIHAAHIRAAHSVVVLGRKPDPCHVHALHPVQWDLLGDAASLGSGWVSG